MKNKLLLLTVSLLLSLPASAGVLTFSTSGNFAFDNDVILFDLNLLNPSHVSIFTSSYAAGGFEPHLELFDGTGLQQFAVSNGGVPACVPNGPAPVRPVNLCGDAEVHEGPFISDEMAPGHYIIALSQTNNYSDGFDVFAPFVQDGPAGRNYTAFPGVCDTYFCDSFFLTPNSSNWTLNVALERVNSTPEGTLTQLGAVPEPASMSLLAIGLTALALRRRRVAATTCGRV